MSAAAFLRSRCFPAAADGLRNKDRSLPILLFVMLLAVSGPALADNPSSGLFYTNCQVAEVPWSIHIVRVERTNALYELYSQHAGGRAIGLSTLSAQIALIKP